MNHVKNIKEMLGMPTGSSRNVATSGYASFTDSQFLFGSQGKNSQGTSQDMSVSSRTSQQSSQEGSDPKFASSYHTKPLLFGELDFKSNILGIVDKFDEGKKWAKEKAESGILAKECHSLRETLNNIQQLVDGTERKTAVCQSVLERFDNFTATLQNNLNSLQSDISQQFEILLTKVTSQKETMTKLEERVQKSGDATVDLSSNLQSLKNSLECLREEQERERKMIEEALKLLSTVISAKPIPERVVDSAIQTSPGLEQPPSNVLQDNKLEGPQLSGISHNLEYKKAEVPPWDPSHITGKRKHTLRGHISRRKRPLVLSHSKHTVTNENSQPLIYCKKQQNVSVPLKSCDLNTTTIQHSPGPDCLNSANSEIRSVAAGSFITPLSCWSQDSNSSACLAGIEPILEKLSAESRAGTPAKRDSLWQLFDLDCDSVLGF